jgi:hypothetical protein
LILTGGFSSKSSPLVGLALKFAKTPSFAPPDPYVWPGRGAKTGICVTRLSTGRVGSTGDIGVFVTWSPVGEVLVINRERSFVLASWPSSDSSSEGLSKVSASSRSASERSGSCRESGEEARERKEGGGELGMVGGEYGPSTWSPSSCVATASYRWLMLGGRATGIRHPSARTKKYSAVGGVGGAQQMGCEGEVEVKEVTKRGGEGADGIGLMAAGV